MELVFEEMANRSQCSCKFLVRGVRMQCRFSTSTIVTIPEGLSYIDGRLKQIASSQGATLSICQNHKARLKMAFAEMF